MSGPRGTLWLHVGAPKTATTSIQAALQDRRAQLAAADRALQPVEVWWELAERFVRENVKTHPRFVNGWPVPTLSQLREVPALIARHRENMRDMVISAETFYLCRTALEAHALATTLFAPFERVVVILATRSEAEWRESRHGQMLRTGMLEGQAALPDSESLSGRWTYDIDSMRRFWSEIAELREIDYDATCAAESSMLPAFARAIELPDLFDGMDLWLNPRYVPS